MAEPQGNMLRELEVVSQSTKVGIDSRGVIIYRESFGQGGEAVWRGVFQDLAASVKALDGVTGKVIAHP